MDMSVIICTYNRADQLRNVLRSLSQQIVPEQVKWEVVVVDNNSTDDTFEAASEFCNMSQAPVRYVREMNQGLSHARNRGVTESKGKHVVFTDDDCIADPKWLNAIYAAFQEYGCDCVGGKICLSTKGDMPRWLNKDLWGFLGFLDYGNVPFELKDEKAFGGNMAFTRDILDKTGYFNTELGRTPTSLLGGEEYELIERVKGVGGRIIYQPTAIVHHVIGPEKLARRYFRRLHYYEGLYNGKAFDKGVTRQVFGIPFFVVPHILRAICKFIKTPTLRMQMNIWWYLGFTCGRYKAHKNYSNRFDYQCRH